MSTLAGKVGIVTGAGRGIGEAYAKGLATAGAAVVVADIDLAGAERVAAQIASDGGTVAAVSVDVSDPDSTRAMARATDEQFGGIDLLVNNAAIFGGMELNTLIGIDWDYYRRFMAVNMDGALLCTRACYRSMRKRGGGSIVNQSSTAAWLYSGYYGLAKVGINGLTQQLAQEVGSMGIRVNAIAPGPINTEAAHSLVPAEYMTDMIQGLALKREGTPQDLVGMCLFLLSDEASWITGQTFNVDGGQIVRS